MRERSPTSLVVCVIPALFAAAAAFMLPAPAHGGGFFCECCSLFCYPPEGNCPDSKMTMMGMREPSSFGEDKSCCTLCSGTTCRSGGATCSVSVQNRTKYTLTGNVAPESFGLGGSWQSETVTTSDCTLNVKPSDCQCVKCEAGLVYTITDISGTENCATGTCSYSGRLKELTGCYSKSIFCNC